ncbi:immunoglobulin lambda-1 light chain-like [Hoplias malabaricus]|uniref:immunoglobulin lambda-1 light chain-like n=1 Tax=Hoplias malabaricus TaxID=27720 RepID=UPI003461A353
MLPALCTLFTVLSCVSGVTVVTQKPPVLTATKGEKTTLHCNLGSVTNYNVVWYKQVPGEVPHISPGRMAPLLILLIVSSLGTAVPSHTDKMLPALCTLFTALSCVSGVTVVTQKPPVLTATKEEKITLHCNLGSVTNSGVRWYKQIPGGVPQNVLYYMHSVSAPSYGSGFSSPKVTSTHSSPSDYTLIIDKVEVGDYAVYYCQTYDSSVNEHVSHTVVFGQGTKLFVTDASAPAPVLTLFPPSSEELKSNKASLVCVVSDMPTGFADVSWLVDSKAVSSGVTTGSAEQQTNKKFRLSSFLTIERSEWEKDKDVTCQVSSASKTASKKLKKSECIV